MTTSGQRIVHIIATLALVPTLLCCSAKPNRNTILVPLDDRPATSKYPQKIAAIGGWAVHLPTRKWLGQYKDAGNPEEIQKWLKSRDLPSPRIALFSIDMLVYGGMLASRETKVTLDQARKRLDILRDFHEYRPQADIYAFSNITRLEPNPVPSTVAWRSKVSRWGELKPANAENADLALASELAQLEGEIGTQVISDVTGIRKRNLEINLAALDLVKRGVIDQLVFSQEDPRPRGLHRVDEATLRQRIKELGLETRVRIEQTADETSSLLLSRVVLESARQSVRIKPVYSSERARKVVFPSEGMSLEERIEHHVRATGAALARDGEQSDYLLYINAPETNGNEFVSFLSQMLTDLKSGKVVALADTLGLPPEGTGADERIMEALGSERLFDRLAAYAAYGTPGNELGTVIAAANMRIMAMRTHFNTEEIASCEAARVAFLFQRFMADYVYLNKLKPELDRTVTGGSEQLGYEAYQRLHFTMQMELTKRAYNFFDQYFKGNSHSLPGHLNRSITITRPKDIHVYVPWFRAFEAGFDLNLDYTLN